jgi:hypothetical protein
LLWEKSLCYNGIGEEIMSEKIKKCGQCGQWQSISKFYCRRLDGQPHRRCKTCQKENRNKYRSRYREKCITATKAWTEKNKEKFNASRKAWAKKNAIKLKEYHKAYYQANQERIKSQKKEYRARCGIVYDNQRRYANHLKQNFGLTVQDFNRLSKLQNGCCAICGEQPKRKLHVDHCHTTGKIRGLLCQRCNMGLGNFCDSPELLVKAIAYLGKNGAKYAA